MRPVGVPVGLHSVWPVSVTVPYPEVPDLVFGRSAARSEQFGGTAAAGGAPVVIGSAAGRTEADVTARARGEVLERAGNIVSGRRAESQAQVVGSFAELSRRGIPLLDPASLPRGEMDARAASMMWVRGRSEITGEEVFVPAGAVYLRHRAPTGCVAGVRAGSTGLAAHPEPAAALAHAAREILERDALVRTWYGEPDSILIDEGVPVAGPVAEICRALGLAASMWTVEHDGDPRCLIACVASISGGGQAFGARCGDPDDQTAVQAAVYEALMVRWSMTTPAADRARRALLERRDGPRNGIEHAVHAFDTGYASSYLARRASGRHSSGPRPVEASDPLAQLHDATGADVVSVDTSPRELDGVSVVRLVAPGTRQLPGREPAGLCVPPHPFG